jgi:signal transduction histidine kinase
MLSRFRGNLRDEIRTTVISRDASVLLPVAQRELAERANEAADPADLLAAVLDSAQQEDMLGVAIFDEQGKTIRYAPGTLLFPVLNADDLLRLVRFETISRFNPEFPLNRYFSGFSGSKPDHAPVLEVLLPLHGRDPQRILGFAQYLIDGRSLATQLAEIDQRTSRQTNATLAIGAALIAAVVAASATVIRRAQQTIDDRTARLARASTELMLAAKASAVGQIASNLVHGLQGSVASLRALVASREGDELASPDWNSVAGYAETMQSLIRDTVFMLRDTGADSAFDLTGHEIASIVRDRNVPVAAEKGVQLNVTGSFDRSMESHRGGILCLIAGNLVQNAIVATDSGKKVTVEFKNEGDRMRLVVSDEGRGIPSERKARLFEPGQSSRQGGTGLGLALSQLMARQIGASLVMVRTGPTGTEFEVSLGLS